MSDRTRSRDALALAAFAAMLLLTSVRAEAGCDCSKLPSLESGLRTPAMSLWSNVSISGTAWATNGNVGLGDAKGVGGGKLSVTGKATVLSDIYHDTNTSVNVSEGVVGSVTQMDLSGVVQDVYVAHSAFAALAPTQIFGKVSNNRIITGNGCINVIQVDEIALSSKRKLTFKGGPDDYFIVNIVNGGFSISSDGGIILDGVEPSHLIFNVVGGGGHVSLSGKSAVYGTFLNPDKGISVSSSGDNRGAYYAGDNLSLSAGSSWHGEPFMCAAVAACPDPRSTGINIQTPATPPARSSGNASFFYSWFDTTTYEGHLESYKVLPGGSLEDESANDPVDSTTNKLKDSRDPWWDAGIRLRTDTTRSIYTTKSGARVDFDTTIDAVDLDIADGDIPSYPNYPASGVATLTELADAIVDYIHGKDAFDLDGDNLKTEMRSAVLGDIFHSNVLFIGSPTTILAHEQGHNSFLSAYQTRDRVAYAGANDAMVHAFDAGAYWDQTDPTAWNDGSGDELFGYVPGLLRPMASLTPKTIDANGDRLVPGFVDGNLVAADAWLGSDSGNKTGSEWATVLIAAFRDGGEGYLALDITDPGAVGGDHGPYPKLLWEFSHSKLGKSWSRPVVTRVKVRRSGETGDACGLYDGDGDCREQWVAIFAGGLETTGDPNDPTTYISDPTSLAWRDASKSLFMVALDTGQLLASVEFDSSGATGPSAMKYSIPSAPAVFDLDNDGFGDVVYVGDLGGQVWKWVINPVGLDGDADGDYDNWSAGVFFDSPPVAVSGGGKHYRSFYSPPAGAYVNGELTIAIGSSEQRDILYQGEAGRDDNNRFYVIQDPAPLSIGTTLLESDLVPVTSSATYVNPGGMKGYYFVGEESEKYVGDPIIFAGHVLTVSYKPEVAPTCGAGEAFYLAFQVGNAAGYLDDNGTPEAADRRTSIGSGVPSNPRISIGGNPSDDIVLVTTTTGEVLTLEPPARDPLESGLVFWRQLF
jgi:hypothetical protein